MTSFESDYIKKWIIKANNDLKAAQHEIQNADPVTDAVCFHCEQAVEKFFKAFLIYNHIDFEKNHNLFSLQESCIEISKDFNNVDLKNLNFFGVTERYPDDFYIPEVEEAKEYIIIAEQVKNLVESMLINI